MPLEEVRLASSLHPGWVSVFSPYNKDFVEALKECCPPGARYPYRHPITHRFSHWDVELAYIEDVIELCKEYYADLEIVNDIPPQPDTHTWAVAPSVLEDVITQLFLGTPTEQLLSLYHHLSFVYHPDQGGTNDAMKALNAVWARVSDRAARKRSA